MTNQLLADFSLTDDPVNGVVVFTPNPYTRTIKLNWNLNCSKLKDKEVGFHIHEHQLTSKRPTCDDLGPHWDPTDTRMHGYHLGDLCFNIYFNKHGKSRSSWISSTDLYDFYNEITNRSLVIHDKRDDKGILRTNLRKKILYQKKLTARELESLKTGNAGKRVGCANIVPIKIK